MPLDFEVDDDTEWTWVPLGLAAARVVLDCADQMGCDTAPYREGLQ